MKEQNLYAGILERIKVITIDGIVMVIFIIIATYLLSLFQEVPDSIRIIVFVFIFFIYDPLFTAFIGGTIGHYLVRIRVKKESDENKNISFPPAVIRYLIKTFLGIISLIVVSNNEKRRALHDYIAGSVVIYKTTK